MSEEGLDLELYAKDLKAKFEDVEKIVFNDKEVMDNYEMSRYSEERTNLDFMLISHIRMLYHRISILERLANLPGLTKIAEKAFTPVDDKPNGDMYL